MSIFSSNRDNNNKDTNTSSQPVVSSATASTYTPPSNPTPTSNYSSSPMTTISEGTVLDGQIKIEGDIKIEGVVKGSVTSKGKVMVTGSGKVEGDVICQNGEIAGRIMGKLKVADILFLKGNAVIDGDINTGKLVIEAGVKFNGNCSMGTPTVAAASITPKPEVKTTVELNAQ